MIDQLLSEVFIALGYERASMATEYATPGDHHEEPDPFEYFYVFPPGVSEETQRSCYYAYCLGYTGQESPRWNG